MIQDSIIPKRQKRSDDFSGDRYERGQEKTRETWLCKKNQTIVRHHGTTAFFKGEICLSVCLPVCMYLYVFMSVCMYVCVGLPACLSVCLPVGR